MKPSLGELESDRPLTLSSKVMLGVEILVTYVRARWLMRKDIRIALATLRRPLDVMPEGNTQGGTAGRRLGRTVATIVGRLPTDSRCLARSLVLTGLLARRGVRSTLVIAVRPGSDFAAHAWVERQGEPLLWTGGSQYERLTDL